MKTCDEVLDLLPEYMPLVDNDALAVHDHLKVCADCADAADDLAETLHVLTTLAPPAPAPGPELADAVMARIESLPTPRTAPPAPAGRVLPFPGLLRAAAAVACFAAGIGAASLLGRDAPPAELQARGPIPERAVERAPAPAPVPSATEDAAPRTDERPATTVVSFAADRESVDYYVSEASMVLRAVERLDQADPRWLEILALHIRDSGLLDEGERLLLAYEHMPADPQSGDVRPLIHGAQLILRKVHHARESNAPERLYALRREVRETGLIDAMDAVLAAEEVPAEPPGRDQDDEQGPL